MEQVSYKVTTARYHKCRLLVTVSSRCYVQMAIRFAFLVVCAGAILAPLVSAESTDCTTPVLIVTDGRFTASTFAQGATYWYGIYAQGGHSYAVEFVPAADNYLNAVTVQFGPISVYGPTDTLPGCHGNSTVSVTQNSGYSPVLKNGNGTGRRVSFTAQRAGLHVISITNATTGASAYSFRAVDTTLFNPRWSTYGGYDNAWGFLNVSDMTIVGILTVNDVNGHAVASAQITILPGAERFTYTTPSEMSVPRNVAGYATFTHNGPPGSIIADAYMQNLAVGVVFVSRFDTRGMQ